VWIGRSKSVGRPGLAAALRVIGSRPGCCCFWQPDMYVPAKCDEHVTKIALERLPQMAL
jgi:hypothetical protein